MSFLYGELNFWILGEILDFDRLKIIKRKIKVSMKLLWEKYLLQPNDKYSQRTDIDSITTDINSQII